MTRQTDEFLRVRCPFCGADAGQPCVVTGDPSFPYKRACFDLLGQPVVHTARVTAAAGSGEEEVR